MTDTSLRLGANVTPSIAGFAARHLLWMEGARLNAQQCNMGHIWIDRRTPEATTWKVLKYFHDTRHGKTIRADLLEYFRALKLETN